MNRNACIFCFLVLTLAALGGCSKTDSKKAETAPHKIQGKAELQYQAVSANDTALNGGGPAVYIWQGPRRYRLYLRKRAEVTHDHEYVVEGVFAQKVIDDIGDPDQGKTGYPLQGSCERVIKTAWPGLAFDEVDARTSVLRAIVKRYPARPVFLVARIRPATAEEISAAAAAAPKKSAAAEDIPEVTVPAEKHRALMIEGPTVQTAPLWEPAGGTVKCKVVIDPEGKISDLETGAQLCEKVEWSQFRFKPLLQKGKPVVVKTEVEVRFDPRK